MPRQFRHMTDRRMSMTTVLWVMSGWEETFVLRRHGTYNLIHLLARLCSRLPHSHQPSPQRWCTGNSNSNINWGIYIAPHWKNEGASQSRLEQPVSWCPYIDSRRSVYSWRRNEFVEHSSFRSVGSVFHAHSAATENTLYSSLCCDCSMTMKWSAM